ncbi:hypothetical protein GUJ93_ZPchr0001g31133 [Zizania palustris]|uniref:Uncharacterized protein n=1 Tax=Zizania palustris TaxID=103762 RepID=A0A8J5V087_ZIZPA|nr:hypothetical protein GUJ93_ZPchr0001g31133 [Zizania palustris]
MIKHNASSSSLLVSSFLPVTSVGGGRLKEGEAMKRSDIHRFFDAFTFDLALLNGCGVGRGSPATTTAGSSSAHHRNLVATYQLYMGTTVGLIVVLNRRLISAARVGGRWQGQGGHTTTKRPYMEHFFGAFAFDVLDGVGHGAPAATAAQARPPTTCTSVPP